MKKILFIISLCAIGFAAQSQTLNPFPTTDSLRKYVNKWIRNSAIDAFTQLRLNTALNGMTRFVDSVYGGQVAAFSYSSDTLRLTLLDGDVLKVPLPASAGNANLGSGFRVLVSSSQGIKTVYAGSGTLIDSTSNANALTFKADTSLLATVNDVRDSTVTGVGGITKKGKALTLQGTLDSFQLIRVNIRKDIPLGPGNPHSALVISNTGDSIEIPFLQTGTTSDRSLLYMHRYYYPNDTVNGSYGGLLNLIDRRHMDPTQKTYVNASRPYFWTYSGLNISQQIRNADSMYLQTSPYGHTGGSNIQNDLGQASGNLWINMFSQSNISSPYPIANLRLGLDLARVSSAGKRTVLGPGFAGAIVDWRNHQIAITAPTTEYGSYISRLVAFEAYGLLSDQSTSPSKAKTLAVSTIDTAIGLWVKPMRKPLNEVWKGVGIWAEGDSDNNHMAGKLSVGGPLQLYGQQVSRFHVNDTVPTATFGPSAFTESSSNVNVYVLQNGVSAANIASKKSRGLYVWKETNYDGFVNLNGRFQNGMLGYNMHSADSGISMIPNGNGDISGHQFALAYRKKAGWTDTTYFIGGPNGRQAPTGLSALLDFSQSGIPNVTRLNWAKGNHSAFTALINFNAWHRMESGTWIVAGGGAAIGANSQMDTGTILRLVELESRVLNPYAINQEGIRDSVLLRGPIRVPYMPTGGSSDSVVVVAAGGVMKRVLQSSITGGSPALTTNQIGVGISSVLGGTSAYTYDGTTVKQENALAVHAVTSTTTVGSTSGGVLNLYAKDLPTAANQVLGTINFGSRNGTTADNVGIRLRAATNGAWTDGSAEQAYFTIETNATGTLNEIARWTANGRTSFGGIANPNSRLQIAAGSTSLAPLSLTTGNVLTTPVAGAVEWDVSANGGAPTFTPVSTRYKAVLSNTGAATDGQIPIGSTSSGVYTSATLSAGEGMNITNASGSITINARETGTMSGDGSFTIASNIGLQRLIAITANRTVTFPTPTEGKHLYVWNANNAGFTWQVSGSVSVVLPDGTTITSLTNGTMTAFIGTGSEWIKIN